MSKSIIIKGAKVNNLKNIDVEIPRDKLVVLTGLSGSGKSTLAFDTIFAEGQRRYMDTLSTYAKHYMGRLEKLKQLEAELRSALDDADPRTLPQLPRQYRETLREIDELEKDDGDIDEIARILDARQSRADAAH